MLLPDAPLPDFASTGGGALFLRRPSQSLTHSGVVSADVKLAGAVAAIHISASVCLQGNFRDGQVHL